MSSPKGFSRQKSSSLKERLFIHREKRSSKSVRARLQSTDSAKADVSQQPSNTKYTLITEFSHRVHVLEKNVLKNIWERLRGNSRFPWNWNSYKIILGEKDISSTTPVGPFEKPIPYCSIESCMAVQNSHLPFCYIKIATAEQSFLIQVPDIYQRDRLLNSIHWMRSVYKYEKILYSATRPEIILQELQSFVKQALEGPIDIADTHHALLKIVSYIIFQDKDILNVASHEALMTTLSPLFRENPPSIEICSFFTQHCRDRPRSRIVIEVFTPMVQRILKYNTNFGRTIWLRNFVRDYIKALSAQNNGENAVRAFVQEMHGLLSICPHKRIHNNLVSICLSAIYECFSADTPSPKKKSWGGSNKQKREKYSGLYDHAEENEIRLNNNNQTDYKVSKFNKNQVINSMQMATDKTTATPTESGINLNEFHPDKQDKVWTESNSTDFEPDHETALIFMQVLDEISKLSDWIPGLAVLLQPIPFQNDTLHSKPLLKLLSQILGRMVDDGQEHVVWCFVSLREQKKGWIQVFNPQSKICQDGGDLFLRMVESILKTAKVAGKTKKLVSILRNTCFNDVLLLGLRGVDVMVEVLCLILRYQLVSGQVELQVVSTLRSSALGRKRYQEFCEREEVMLQKGGPEEYTLPPGSTDQDLHNFLNSASYGNLKNLNLSFTSISCKSAESISRLPSLQHLNLWSSNMQDVGLRKLCEGLNLTSLNLCETHVTDDGVVCLKDMSNLTDLNLNSTSISEHVHKELRHALPNLIHCDVTYTDAWFPRTGENNAVEVDRKVAPAKKLNYQQNIPLLSPEGVSNQLVE